MAIENKTDTGNAPEIVTSPETLSGKANQVIETALKDMEDSKAIQDDSMVLKDAGDAGGKFRGLPMRDLIGGPLVAAAEAQQNLASVAWDFYQKVAFEKKEETTITRVIEFTVNRPVEQDGKLEMMPQKIEAPFIGLVPIPSLLIDRVDVDFQMEVTDNNVEKTSSQTEAASKISGGWWLSKVEISGKVSSSRENTRTTNQTAKYQVRVSASQQPQTEGLAKLMDIMASCIEPVAVSKKS